MKKTLSAILALTLAFSLCACSNNGGEAPAEPTDTPAPTQDLSVYEKSEGKLESEVWYNANGLKFNTIKYEYDGSGALVKETTLGINDEPVGYKEYILNADGLAETMISYVASGPEEYTEEYRVLYEYNETGLKMKESSVIDGSVTAYTAYAYEGKNLVSEKYFEGLVNEASFESVKLISDIAYEYDDAGKLVKLTRQDMLEESETVETYSYDDNGRLAEKQSAADGSLISRTEYKYDEHGNELSVNIYGPDGTAISLTSNEYEYDEPGNVIKGTRTQADGEQNTVIEYTWSYVKG